MKRKNISLMVFFAFSYFLSPAEEVSVVRQLHGIEVTLCLDADSSLNGWKSHTRRISYLPLPASELEHVFSMLEKAMGKYPEQVLKKNVNKVFVFRKLKMNKVIISGLQQYNSIFLSIPIYDTTAGPLFEKLFHHEFSHCLFKRYKKHFDKVEWKKNCGKEYSKDAWNIIAVVDQPRKYSAELYPFGFLHLYATSNIDEDFTSFAENIFMKEEEFWQAALSNPLLFNKLKITMVFYEKIDPELKKNFGRTLK